MKFYVNVNAAQGGCGTQEKPFRSIQEAAQIAQPGDEILVAPGVYREYVDPIHAGTEEAPITYRRSPELIHTHSKNMIIPVNSPMSVL